MASLRRLGTHLGTSARPCLAWISPVNLATHTRNSHLFHGATRTTVRLRRGLPGATRDFSIASILDGGITGAQQLITSLHIATGTPWYITIPLVALALNVVLRLPLAISLRQLEQKRTRLLPLLFAWRFRHQREFAESNSKTMAMVDPKTFQRAVEKRLLKTSRRIYKAHNVQMWKRWTFLVTFPYWLTIMEALRRMSGAPLGLIGVTIAAGGKETEAAGAEGDIGAVATTPPDTPMSLDMVSADDGSASAGPLLGYDPSMATGGCLWFPDLTVADPVGVLPYLLSAAFVISILPRSKEKVISLLNPTVNTDDAAYQTSAMPQQRFRRAALLVALCIGPLTMQLPAALHLYWLTSTIVSGLQTEVVYRMMPLPKQDWSPCRGLTDIVVRPPPPKTHTKGPEEPQKKVPQLQKKGQKLGKFGKQGARLYT